MKKLKVLIVDDDIIDRAYYQRIFKQSLDVSHQIFEAETGKSALAILQTQEIDCILLDYHLPDINGIELIADLKKIGGHFIPIIMLTGRGDESVAVKSLKAGAVDYIMKSKIDPKQLVLLIKNLIRNFYLMKLIDQQKQKIEAFAFYDFLTGLISFPTFYQILKYALSEAIRFNHAIGIIYIDVDNFVVINDTFGHLAGDEVLIEMSKRLKSILSNDTIVCRAGEDEFIILISGFDIEAKTLALAESLQSLLKKSYSLFVDKISLTVSIGITCLDHPNITVDQLLQNAEHAIAVAKKKGGNNIEFFKSKE